MSTAHSLEGRATSAISLRVALLIGLAVAAAVAVATAMVDPYSWVGDDGGITLRYARRIAAGEGFSYNDGEAVNGASNPLYTLALAGVLRLGATPAEAVNLIAIACIALTSGVLFAAFTSLGSPLSGLFAVLATLVTDWMFFMNFDGLEPPFVFFLAACLFAALCGGSRILVGVALGLLFANKLDGALAAIAFTLVELLRSRRFPLREALVAAAAAAPVLLVLFINFGSIFPNSMGTKLTGAGHHTRGGFDPLWMHSALLEGSALFYVPALASVAWSVGTLGRGWPRAVLVIQVWFVLSLVVYANVDLGAPYPWYAATALICSAILGAAFVMRLGSALARLAGSEPLPRAIRAIVPAAAAIALLVVERGAIADRWGPQQGGMPLHEAQKVALQASGAWLRKHADHDEMLGTHLGLPAFEYTGPVYDAAGLSSERDEARFAEAEYAVIPPRTAKDSLRWTWKGRRLVATFFFDGAAPGYSVYAHEDSQIGRSGVRHIVFPLPGAAEALPSTWRGHRFSVPAGKQEAIVVRAPIAPTLTLQARAERAPARLVLESAGRELGAFDVGEEARTLTVELAEGDGVAEDLRPYDVVFRVERTGEKGTPRPVVRVDEILLRIGEPLVGDDLILSNARRRARVDRVAERGLPWRATTP
ncbi:MAG: hypothetical protein AAF726_13450 [Planctomycetota bacterium]